MKNIFIVGQNNLLGIHLAYTLSKYNRVFMGDFNGRPVSIQNTVSFSFNLKEEKWIKSFFARVAPEIIIYIGASHAPSYNEKEHKIAELFHSSAIGEVLKQSERVSSKFLYLSSSLVFDGSKGNYKESDTISPYSNLGRFKANGENVTKNRTTHFTILRTPPLIGKGHPKKPGFLDNLHKRILSQEQTDVQNYEIYNFASIPDTVKVIEALIKRDFKKEVYHYGGLTKLTHYELACLYANACNLDMKYISPIDRPHEKSMVHSLHRLDFSINSSEVIKNCGVHSYEIEDAFNRL